MKKILLALSISLTVSTLNATTQEVTFPLCNSPTSQSKIYDSTNEILFNLSFYLSVNPDVAEYYGTDYQGATQHWENYGIHEGRIASPSFDVQYYLSQYQDIKSYFGSNFEGATRHWFKQGLREGRKGSPVFDVQYYLSSNPDLYDAFGANFYQATSHWLNNGTDECRVASHQYQPITYLDKNKDIDSVFNGGCTQATLHWLKWGKNESRVQSSGLNYAVANIDCNKIGTIVPEPEQPLIAPVPIIKPIPEAAPAPAPAPAPKPDHSYLSGNWNVTQTITSTTCTLASYSPVSYSTTVSVRDNYVTIRTRQGTIIKGEIRNDRLSYSTKIPTNDGTNQIEKGTLVLMNNTISGVAVNTVSYNSRSCSVNVRYSADKI